VVNQHEQRVAEQQIHAAVVCQCAHHAVQGGISQRPQRQLLQVSQARHHAPHRHPHTRAAHGGIAYSAGDMAQLEQHFR